MLQGLSTSWQEGSLQGVNPAKCYISKGLEQNGVKVGPFIHPSPGYTTMLKAGFIKQSDLQLFTFEIS